MGKKEFNYNNLNFCNMFIKSFQYRNRNDWEIDDFIKFVIFLCFLQIYFLGIFQIQNKVK